MALKTDYRNDVLDESMTGRRRYKMINNEDGTVSFTDQTNYTQKGDFLDADDLNNANKIINELNEKKTEDLTVEFTETEELENISTGEKLSTLFGKIAKSISDFILHKQDNNIHTTSEKKLNWDDAYTKAHEHSNKSTIDSLTDPMVDVLNEILEEGYKIDIDSELSETSTNPVQNKVVNAALNNKVGKEEGKGLSTNDYTNVDKEKVSLFENITKVSSSLVDDAAIIETVIPTGKAMMDYIDEFGGGGGSSSIATSEDIPITLLSTEWENELDETYTQSVAVLQLREGMTPIVLLDSQSTDEQIYAYNIITDYSVGNGTIKFYADAALSTDISIVIKGIPTQEVDYVDNTVLVQVLSSGFQLNEETQRYEQTLTVDGMTAGLGGMWDILRSGPVLTIEESKIASIITDVIRLENAIKIVCTEIPSQDFTMVLYGTFKDATDGDVILSGENGLLGRVNTLENEVNTIKNDIIELNSNKVIETIYNGQIQLNQKIPADFSKYAIFYMRIVCTGYASASCELPAIKGAACDFSGVIPQRPGYNIAGTFYIENSNEISVIGLHGGTEISNPEWTIQIWGINF